MRSSRHLPGLSSADGELIAGSLPNGALIAFYRDIEKAVRLAPAVVDGPTRPRPS